MKLKTLKAKGEQASTLLVTLVTSVIAGTTLASYLVLVESQHRSTMRSANWNSSMALTEAGVEDALQFINMYAGSDDIDLYSWTNNYSGNNWTLLGTNANVYYARRYMGSNYYDAYITNFPGGATVNASGYAMWNFNIASAPQTMFAAVGVPAPSSTPVGRRVVVQTKIDALFQVAMAALKQIDFSGKNVATDSFDSADPNYSGTNGTYPFGMVSKTKANGNVVTDDTITNSLAVGNAQIKGLVKTGPTGSVAIGPNGSVGNRAWVEGGSTGIQPGYFADDMNVQFPDVVYPATFLPLPLLKAAGNPQYNGITYDYIVPSSGDYVISQNVSGSIIIPSNVTARIKITGTVNITGSDQIYIAGGANVRIYMAGATCSIGGNGVINQNGNASSFYYFGLPSNTSVTFGGNATFVGAIYAPEAAFTLGGGGNNTIDFIGASVTKTVKMNGHFNFHYDENLARNGMGRGYIPTNWKES